MLRLKQLRLDAGLTQSELSKILKISASAIGMYEQGRREPDYDTLMKMATYFNVSTDYLIGYSDKRNTAKPSAVPFDLTQEEIEHIKKYRQIDSDGKTVLDSTLEGIRHTQLQKRIIEEKEIS